MDIKDTSLNKHLTLKPLPPKILFCAVCRTDFTSYLKTNSEYYKTCNKCRHKLRLQGRKHRKDYKKIILDLKYCLIINMYIIIIYISIMIWMIYYHCIRNTTDQEPKNYFYKQSQKEYKQY
jgi:hypothetical protein